MKKEILVVVAVIGFLFILSAGNFFEVDRLGNQQEKNTVSNVVGFATGGTGCSADGDCKTGYICEESVCTLGCLEDRECSNGKCDIESGRCVSEGGCSSDIECSGTARWCDLSASTCVECYDQYHCSGDLVCNFKTNKCEEAAAAKEPEKPAAEETVVEEVETAVEEKKPTEETFTLKEGETKELSLVIGAASSFKITLNKADNGGYGHELSYQLTNPNGGFGGSGNIKVGSKDVGLWSSISGSTYLMINPLYREGKAVTFRILECKDLSCLDDKCPDYAYEETKFVKGSLSDWTISAGSQRKLCSYEIEETSKCAETDAGKDYLKKGTVTASYTDRLLGKAAKDFTYTDQCITRDALNSAGYRSVEKCAADEYCYVDEVYCTEDERPWRFDRDHRCEFGCKDGACLEKDEKITVFYEDADKDGYGNAKVTKEAAAAPEGYVDKSLDCDDTESSIHPDAAEIANDGIDQDCDGADLVKVTCEDSDGNDLTNPGTVKYPDAEGAEQTFTDRCIGLVGVLEGQCNEDGSFACLDEAKCRNRCPDGQVCSEGACKAAKAQCTDSDGEDKNKAGSVVFTDENGQSQPAITDQCVGYRFVKEGVCNFVNQGRTKVLKCNADEVCRNGACVSSPEKCTDSDGTDREKKGTIAYTTKTGTSGQFTDMCSSNNAYVIEGLCKVDTVLTRAVPCPAGTICSDGACVKGKPAVQFSCKDSDGYNILTTGTVEYTDETGTHKKAETCLDSRTVSENYCVGTSLRTYNLICPTGYSCTAGKCDKTQQVSTSTNWWR